MKTTNESALREIRTRNLKVAELMATDPKDFEECVRNLVASAGLSNAQARIVAAASREKYLPLKAREMGLDEATIAMIVSREGNRTAGFATDPGFDEMTETVPEKAMSAAPAADAEPKAMPNLSDSDGAELDDTTLDAGEPTDGFGDDASAEEIDALPMKEEADDEPSEGNNELATVQIEVPADQIDALKEALEQFFGGSVTEGDFDDESETADLGSEDNDEDGSSAPAFLGGEEEVDLAPKGNDLGSALDAHADEAEVTDEVPALKTANKKANKMTEAEIAQRKASRAALLTRKASEEIKPQDKNLGKDTSEGTYMGEKSKSMQHADSAQYKGETETRTRTMTNSEGNSLKEQNPTNLGRAPIPTNNPSNLQLSDSYEAKRLEGSGDGSLDYDPGFNPLIGTPSAGETLGEPFQVPTQMSLPKHNTTVQMTAVAERKVECQGCNNPRQAEIVECDCGDCRKVVAICLDCENEGYCPSCAAKPSVTASKEKEAEVKVEVTAEDEAKGLTHDVDQRVEKVQKEAAVKEARLKTAFASAYTLAADGLLENNEIEEYAQHLLDQGLTVSAMQTTTLLMRRNAHTNAVKTASNNAAAPSSTRVATAGLSTSPQFISAGAAPQVHDLQDRLRGIFTQPSLEGDAN